MGCMVFDVLIKKEGEPGYKPGSVVPGIFAVAETGHAGQPFIYDVRCRIIWSGHV